MPTKATKARTVPRLANEVVRTLTGSLMLAAACAGPAAADLTPAAEETMPPASQSTPALSAQPAPASGAPASGTPATGGSGSNSAAPKSALPAGKFQLFGNLRVRQEVWDWFGSEKGADKYTFTGSLLRFGATYTTPRNDFMVELAQPTLLNLPKDASLAPPLGQLGLGAAYRDANAGQEASLFIKQLWWRAKGLGDKGNSLRLGRLEFIDGMETVPKDPSLAWLKRERIAHRMLGNFGWSHVQRSYDGGQFVRQTRGLNITGLGAMPTQGVFDLDGNEAIQHVKVGYLAATRPLAGKQFQGDVRVFGIYYNDNRDQVVKTDNRPGAVRAADREDISIGTLGGHFLGLWETRRGKADGLLWAGAQFGDWGNQSHEAYAIAAEAGFQPKGWKGKPWFRGGFYHASGDGDPNDGRHNTWFPVLPTPRIYARFPFYTLNNINDLWGQVILRPTSKWTVRGDVHSLWLADKNDLWYGGGGAFQEEPSFGYAGRPSNGEDRLATLLDVSLDYQVRKDTTLSAYFGYAFAGKVIDRIYSGNQNGFLGYLEVSRKF